MATKIEIVNAALMMIGGEGNLTSFSENNREAQIASRVYESTRDALMMDYHWRFSVTRANLNLTGSTPEFDWAYEFQLPSDCMVVIGTENKAAFEVMGDKLLADVNSTKIIYQREVAEGEFPAYFVTALQYKLASIFAIALAEDEGKAGFYESRFQEQRQVAMARDSGQRSTIAIDTGVFIRARRGHTGV